METTISLSKKERKAYMIMCKECEPQDAMREVRNMTKEQLNEYLDKHMQGMFKQFANVSQQSEAKETKHHKIGVLSDTHVGSIYTYDEWLYKALRAFKDEGCECILHCGDLTEGIKSARIQTQVYELDKRAIGYRSMRDLAVEFLSATDIPMYIISGNHDKFFQDDANIVEDVCARLDHVKMLGDNVADFDKLGVKIRLFHGGDGFSNMRLRNLAFSEQLEHNGVKIFLAGHVHKFEVKYIDNCYMVHVPSIQDQSAWMRSKKLIADTGYIILEYDEENGEPQNLSIKYHKL